MRHHDWIIYTSSYDRGLEHLLKMFPAVKKQVKTAQLHIFYGWKLFKDFYKNNPERMAWMKQMNVMMQVDGVTNHGRVSQLDLVDWYKKCGVFAYSSHFAEISCISAMKAQIYGAIPVTTDIAALKETVKFGVKIKGDIYDPKVAKRFEKELIEMLQNKDKQKTIRKKMTKWARSHYTWRRVAKQWSKEFKNEISKS
jgi:glycosyltransferase involved in cell wall biosynthesis